MTVLIWTGVTLFGGLGAVLRFLVDKAVSTRSRGAFPLGTLVVNLSGALVLGILSGLLLPPTAALLAGTAVIGSYTTFSTWMLESERLIEERRVGLAAMNLGLSLALGIAAAAVGLALGAWWR
jgi:CrcB protein